jgi:DNA-binding transcriptional MerR regulator
MLTIGAFAQLGQVSNRTLRHYDELGLLKPERSDHSTGYRYYSVDQLARLHRILALRDLGFPLDQIGTVVDGAVDIRELRGMLRLRRAQIESTLADEEARLRRVEARLRFLERSTTMPAPDVVVKKTQPLRIAQATGTAPDFGPVLVATFMELVPKVRDHLGRNGLEPGMQVAWYETPDEGGPVIAHIGFDIGDRSVPRSAEIEEYDLPVIEVASLIHEGSMEDVVPVYESLVRWIEDSGYQVTGRSRELYLEWNADDHGRNVTELQMPISVTVLHRVG